MTVLVFICTMKYMIHWVYTSMNVLQIVARKRSRSTVSNLLVVSLFLPEFYKHSVLKLRQRGVRRNSTYLPRQQSPDVHVGVDAERHDEDEEDDGPWLQHATEDISHLRTKEQHRSSASGISAA